MTIASLVASYRRRGIHVTDEDVDNATALVGEWQAVARRCGLIDRDLAGASLANDALDAVLNASRRRSKVEVCRGVAVGDRIVVTPRATTPYALEVTQVIPNGASGVHVEGYRCSIDPPHTRLTGSLVWRFVAESALVERVIERAVG